MTALVTTVAETLRYRGAIGQWSWVLHRLTGLGVLFFLILHVIDTSWSVFYPAKYEEAIAIYQSPLFTLGEFALVAAVVYHALNGLRIVIFDYNPHLWKHQSKAALGVLGVSVLILIPTFIGMMGHVLNHYSGNPFIMPLGDILLAQLPFMAGMGAALIASIVLSGAYGLVAGNSNPVKKGKPSRLERFWWSFMRISGTLIIPLVFGHLAMMHVLQGVFDITAGNNFATVGTNLTNASGTATEFVFNRWSYAIAGVYVWRLYDFALLALAAIHGFNGLRYVLTDYAGNTLLKRALVIMCIIGATILLAVGGAALFATVDSTAIRMAQQAITELRSGAGH